MLSMLIILYCMVCGIYELSLIMVKSQIFNLYYDFIKYMNYL
jgi:hypothetical protein